MKIKTSTFGLFLSIFIFIGIIFILQGCSNPMVEDNKYYNQLTYNGANKIADYVDPETGVHYLLYEGCGITVRYNSDGTIMVD